MHLVGFIIRLLRKTLDFCAQCCQWRFLKTLSSATLQVTTSPAPRGACYRGCLNLLLVTCIGEALQTYHSDVVLRSECSDNKLS